MKKPNKKEVKYFIKGEKKAAREYKPYSKDRGVHAIYEDEKTHRRFWEKRLKKMKEVS